MFQRRKWASYRKKGRARRLPDNQKGGKKGEIRESNLKTSVPESDQRGGKKGIKMGGKRLSKRGKRRVKKGGERLTKKSGRLLKRSRGSRFGMVMAKHTKRGRGTEDGGGVW